MFFCTTVDYTMSTVHKLVWLKLFLCKNKVKKLKNKQKVNSQCKRWILKAAHPVHNYNWRLPKCCKLCLKMQRFLYLFAMTVFDTNRTFPLMFRNVSKTFHPENKNQSMKNSTQSLLLLVHSATVPGARMFLRESQHFYGTACIVF